MNSNIILLQILHSNFLIKYLAIKNQPSHESKLRIAQMSHGPGDPCNMAKPVQESSNQPPIGKSLLLVQDSHRSTNCLNA